MICRWQPAFLESQHSMLRMVILSSRDRDTVDYNYVEVKNSTMEKS